MVRILISNALRPVRPTCRLAQKRPSPISALQQRQFGISPRYLEDEKQQSFKTQLFESTSKRLKRERAEQERFSQHQPASSSGRYAALMFGMQFGAT